MKPHVSKSLVAGAAAPALGVPLSLVAVAATAGAATRSVPGTAPLHVRGARSLGSAPATTRSFTVTLRQRHARELGSLVKTGRTVSANTFAARYAPSAGEVRAVRSWATAQGLSTSVPADRAFVRVSGAQSTVEHALGVRFDRFRAHGHTYTSTTRAATLPRRVAGAAAGVTGLSSLGRLAVPHHATPSAFGLSYPSSYGPKDFAKLYHAPASATGSGQHVAVIAEGDVSQSQHDLPIFEKKFGLPTVPYNKITVGKGDHSDTSGADEWDLDTQYSTGFAPDVSQLDVYDGNSLANDDILASINAWAQGSDTQASFSAGGCELLSYATGFTASLDTVLKQAAAQGKTLFVSSGDTGGFCPALIGVNGVPAGLPGPNYPASSPYVISVGGTTVLGSGPNEIAWYAGGGGTSLVEPTPGFQKSAGGSFLGVRRGVPDVALDADPNSGYEVIVGGSQETIGGTSASAPSWQGIWARAQGAHSGSLGFAGPVLYNTVPRSAFHDIVIGDNVPYPATPGWDYTTGLGTPDITALVSGA